MLIQDINWLPLIASLSSDRVLETMVNQYNNWRILEFKHRENISDCLEMSLHDFTCYLESRIRKEDIESMIDYGVSILDDCQLDLKTTLITLHEEFLEWKGGYFEVKPERLQDWLCIISLIDPAWVVGSAYFSLLEDNIIDLDQLISCLENQCQSALPKHTSNKTFADNHVHLGGHGNSSLSMLDFALYLSHKKPIEKSKWPYRPECTIFNSGKLDITRLPFKVNYLFHNYISTTFAIDECTLEDVVSWDKPFIESIDESLISYLERTNAHTFQQSLIVNSHLASISEPNRWLLLIISLLSSFELDSCKTNQFINIIIIASNLLRNHMIVSGVGLGDFVEFFGFKYRKPNNPTYKPHSLLNDLDICRFREFRISPDTLIELGKQNVAHLNPKPLIDLYSTLNGDERQLSNNVHFVVHFTRGLPAGKEKNDKLLQEVRREICNQVSLIQDFYASNYFSNINIANLSTSQNIDLRTLIRGYDVAGNENELPIEVFAPALRVLKGSYFPTKGMITKRLRRPFITAHAGEDFNHIITGMRSIDETIIFCSYSEDDRIGHGLALGIDVNEWSRKQSRAYVDKFQHLDNLVWLYTKGVELINSCSKFDFNLITLEHKIQKWTRYLYPELKPTISDLQSAWKLRRNSPEHVNSEIEFSSRELELWCPDKTYINKNKNSTDVIIWNKYINYEIQEKIEKKDELVNISLCEQSSVTDPIAGLDYFSESEKYLLTAVQDMLIEEYSRKKIIFEACPTSNIYIGRFCRYWEHPIFRWSPPDSTWIEEGGKFNRFGIRTGSLKVCVNTDDAGLMPTTIENEHKVLENTAIRSFGVSSYIAEQWIDKVRELGVEIFGGNHIRTVVTPN